MVSLLIRLQAAERVYIVGVALVATDTSAS